MEGIEESFKAMSMTSFGAPTAGGVALAKRPDNGGVLGKKLQLFANVYRLRFKKSGTTISHYDVACKVIPPEQAEGGTAPPPPRPQQPRAASDTGLNRETSNAIWDALVASNPDGLGPSLASACFDCRKNAFVLGRLNIPGNVKTFRVTLEPEAEGRAPRTFDVKLQLAQEIDLSVLEAFTAHRQIGNVDDRMATAIMALDVLLRHSSFRKPGVIVGGQGRKFLDTKQAIDLGEGAQVLGGLFQSVRPTMNGVVVNLDTAFSPYITSGNLLHVCRAILGHDQQGGGGGGPPGRGGFRGGRGGGRGGRGGFVGGQAQGPPKTFSERDIRELRHKLKTAKVRLTHRDDKRVFQIKAFGQPAGQHTFSLAGNVAGGKKAPLPGAVAVAQAAARGEKLPTKRAEVPGERVTVAEYFKTRYNKIVDPNMPVVELAGGQFVPLECVELLPGRGIPPTQLSSNQASNMINVAAKVPAERRTAIDQIRQQGEFGPNSKAAAWGLEIEPSMMPLTGRVLPAPQVQYHPSSGRGAKPFVNFGAWNLRDSKFYQANKPLERWGVVNFSGTPDPVINQFFAALMSQAQARGMNIKSPQPRVVIRAAPGESTKAPISRAAQAIVNDRANPSHLPPQLLFFVLADPKAYNGVKRSAAFDFPVAIPSQVLLAKKLSNPKGVDQYCGNVCLKLNLKLGGVNSILSPNDLPKFGTSTMLLGADVSHSTGAGTPRAGTDADVNPSIAAVVATTDGSGNKYSAQIREQSARTEIIQDMKEMTSIHVKEWSRQMKGQRPDQIIMMRDGVSEGQLSAVVQSEVLDMKAACREIDPKYNPKLLYVVCAKRHNIRFFASNPADQDRTGNLPAGTVVDSGVTHPYLWECYLQAHAGLKGTAKPTRYICILDEIGFTSDQLEKLLNSLCYNFGRATRSVSLVPAAYFADIVAGKARSYVEDDDTYSVSSGASRPVRREAKWIQQQLDKNGGDGFKGTWWV
ncbi:argonaute/piwi family protein [Sporobolomyces salmoneus]|uniref:argonaute/piwi family protein n=1 Tax=Sporobolomyces salmoneus TaxID=183962 RepID=UPI003178926D